jgi:multidrug efflux pump subunit AcrB
VLAIGIVVDDAIVVVENVERIKKNYRRIVGFNSLLIVLGVTGVIQPTTSALLHNSSTLLIGLESMQNLLD